MADTAEREQKNLEGQLLENTRKYYSLYREAYENYVHDYLRQNYQLMMLYDEELVRRQKDATKIIRGTINIPKMQPELYARMSQEAKVLLGGKPIWKANAPQNANKETLDKHKTIEECINDLMYLDNWFWVWYSARFWAMLAPYSVLQERHAVEYAYHPDKTYNAQTKLLNFEYREVFNGPRTRVWFPWEIFYDITNAILEPPLFKRFLVSDEEVAEKLAVKEWRITAGKENETRSANTGLRNYGLEIIRSVPRKAGEGTEERRPLKDQHEVLECLNYVVDQKTKKRTLLRWWVLNSTAVVKGPEVVQARRTANNHVLCAARRIPGFSFGMPPADSAKQIQRATNQTYNGRHEALLYGLAPPYILNEGEHWVEDRPVIAPAAGIRKTGNSPIQFFPSGVSPAEAESILSYLDIKGQLATNTNAPMLGQFKPGTPPSALESSQVGEGQGNVLGMFLLTEQEFFRDWASKKYWTMMEDCPVNVEYNGRAYDLLDMIVGEPQFDMPQLGEAAGRTADKLQIQAFFSTVAPFFQAGPITRETNPQLFALIEEFALSLNLTRIDKILEPEETKAAIDPTGPDEIEMVLQEKDVMNRQELAAAQKPNGTKGAERGKEKARV